MTEQPASERPQFQNLMAAPCAVPYRTGLHRTCQNLEDQNDREGDHVRAADNLQAFRLDEGASRRGSQMAASAGAIPPKQGLPRSQALRCHDWPLILSALNADEARSATTSESSGGMMTPEPSQKGTDTP